MAIFAPIRACRHRYLTFFVDDWGWLVQASRIVWQSIRNEYEELMVFVPLSMVWWLCALVVILLPPATVGLVYLANEIAHERRIGWRMALEGARLFFWRSWLVFLVSLVGTAVLTINVLFYLNLDNILRYVTILWIYVLLIWLTAQVYVFPLLVVMEEPRVLVIYRNALLLALSQPLFTVLLLIIMVVLTVFSALIPIFLILITPGLWALASTLGLAHLLDIVRRVQEGDTSEDEEKAD